MHPQAPHNENHFPSARPSSSSSSKMFTSLPPLQSSPFNFQSQSQNYYTPTRPSPLSSSPLRPQRSPLASLDENASFSFTMSSPPPQPSLFSQPSALPSSASSAPSKRIVKKNPLIHRDEKDGGRETRRKLFLKRVREDSEDKRWDAKGGDDELLRSIYNADRKRDIGRNLRYEGAYDGTPEDYEVDEELVGRQKMASQQKSISRPIPRSAEEEMADEVARQEEAELQAYLEMMEAEEAEAQRHAQYQHQQQQQEQPQISWQGQQQQGVQHVRNSASDEIDYDKMFEDMNMDGTAQDNGIRDDEDMMDMS